MFTKKDFQRIDEGYFTILSCTGYNICLQSKNTKHIWTIHMAEIEPGKRRIEIYHQHKKSDERHKQPRFHPKNIVQAQELIKQHDEYQIGKTKGIT